ncbi:MAG: sigma 54-interacting transcriptional regulator [Myxococcota bacterium]|nr:sigma 54-interacting transcriptional regulator [Myxococcota bacterium]
MSSSANKPNVLVIDDGTVYGNVIFKHLPEVVLVDPGEYGSERRIPDGPKAISFLDHHGDQVDVILLDMKFDIDKGRLLPLEDGASLRRTRRFQGVAILREIRSRYPDLPVVLLSSYQDLSPVDVSGELGAQSMTYFLDSDDLDALRIRIHRAFQEAALEVDESHVFWGKDPGMQGVRRRLKMLARGRIPVILEGETGTGKSFLAEQFLHVMSGRKGPFITCDLSTVPADLVPSYLFGAVRGAYTGSVANRKGLFEMASGGSLFIDEVQNVPADIQKQLLQVLQDKRVRPLGSAKTIDVDVKVIAASNRPLDEAVASGRFRSDLYMRLSPATRVRIPPLRERSADLKRLAKKFAAQAASNPDIIELLEAVTRAVGLTLPAGMIMTVGSGAKKKRSLSALELYVPKAAWQMLEKHPWPGNTRELSSVVHNIVTFTLLAAHDAIADGLPLKSTRLQVDPGLVGQLLAGSANLLMTDAKDASGTHTKGIPVSVALNPATSLNRVSVEVERQYFLAMFARTDGDFDTMAELLLGDRQKGRAVRLRFNQLGLKVREITN